MSANSHFFSHDFNARNNYKLLELRSEYGWEGYGIFWAICEVISENDKPLPVDRLGAVSVALGVQREFLASFIKFCLDLNIFIQTEAGITSESLEERLEHKRAIIKKRSEAGKKSALARQKNQSDNQESNKCSTSDEHLLSKRNETKRNETKDLDSKESKAPKKKKSKKLNPDERLEAFKQSIRDAGSAEYSDDMLHAFFDYWSEPMQGKDQFRWEAEKTWGLNRRLSTWARFAIEKNQNPYKPKVYKINDEDKNKKRIDGLIRFLSNPPEGVDLRGAKAEYKVLTGKDWGDQ